MLTGYTPSPLETITPYHPTGPEVSISIGVWALGFLILTILYKVALSVKENSVEIPIDPALLPRSRRGGSESGIALLFFRPRNSVMAVAKTNTPLAATKLDLSL